MKSFAEASRKKLLLMGMSQEEIEVLAKNNVAQNNLYLPVGSDKVWVYMTIYEYEIGLVTKGLQVEIETAAFPGEVFKGEIISFAPTVDNITRSLRARAEIDNPGNKLKPDMFVNAKINIDLGEKLAVSEEAVINTGKRMLVVVADDEGIFISTDVKLGQKALGYYEVLDGLKEGDTVVASGNFLIDSESRLQSAISGEHNHGQ
jgi:Cu(I)/Ag(I) efflux system membrane fusion protein